MRLESWTDVAWNVGVYSFGLIVGLLIGVYW